MGGLENRMAAKRNNEANSGTFGQPNPLDSIDRIGQKLNAAALGLGLTFLFWFRDDSKLSQLTSLTFIKV